MENVRIVHSMIYPWSTFFYVHTVLNSGYSNLLGIITLLFEALEFFLYTVIVVVGRLFHVRIWVMVVIVAISHLVGIIYLKE